MKRVGFFIQWILWSNLVLLSPGLSFSAPSTPTPSTEFSLQQANQVLENAKQEVQRLKDAWDKTRLEATLYEQRSKRAYQKWVKSAKSPRDQALAGKERADLELQLAIERRKLAYVQLQKALFMQTANEAKLQALAQEKDESEIRAKMKELSLKLNPTPGEK
jgi:hypothetical protein